MTLVNGCASGVMAMGDAYRSIANGYHDAMVCGGIEYNVNYLPTLIMEK